MAPAQEKDIGEFLYLFEESKSARPEVKVMSLYDHQHCYVRND